MNITSSNKVPVFGGITKIYSITDTHQETRRTRALLSKILKDSRYDKNVLFLNGGDMLKGVYPKEIEVESYLKLKEKKPDIEMVMAVGNNDLGFSKERLDYYISVVKKFAQMGIKTVCANLFNKDGSRPDWLKPYTIINSDGDKILVTGFCIDNINTAKFGIVPKKSTEVLEEIACAIKKENPDNVIVLNHDYMHSSQQICKDLKRLGVNVDLTIGGHDHEYVEDDTKLNIYYPRSFAEEMYKMDLENHNGKTSIKDLEIIPCKKLYVDRNMSKDLKEYEKHSGLMHKIAPYTLNLPKKYSSPAPLGTFLADEIRKVTFSDIAFFSTGFLMKSLSYEPKSYITHYNFLKTISADNTIKTANLTAKDLKDVFQNALKQKGYGKANPQFLQCSKNIKIEGQDNPTAQRWEVKQIYVDNQPILDKNSDPIDNTKKYVCAMDSYIADGGQGFVTLQNCLKNSVKSCGHEITISEILLKGLKTAPNIYAKGENYPTFVVRDI